MTLRESRLAIRDLRIATNISISCRQTHRAVRFQNNGDLWQPIIYSYRPGIREAAYHNEKRKLSHRVVDRLDASGNVVEHSFYDGAKLDSIEVYKLEFDSHGNWIVRKTFKKSLKTRKTASKPSSIEYRKITYFD